MNKNRKELSKEELTKLKKVLKKYTNYYKALFHINPALADEFRKKQEHYYSIKSKDKKHDDQCKNENKVETKIHIPKEKMNNIEKNINEIYETFFYPSNLNSLLLFFEAKFSKIVKEGSNQGMILDKESEKELIHRLFLEGIPFYISSLLRKKLKAYEESISEQPMLLAHPSSITDKRLLNCIPSSNIEELIKSDYTILPNKIYEDLKQYELFNNFKYLYMEGVFEDESVKDDKHRSDFILNFHIKYFEKSKHKIISEISQFIYALPFELNMKNPNFQLQINDYIQCSYFRENFSYVNQTCDSSFQIDTGKKITFLLVLFPDEVELSKRILTINLYNQENKEIIKTIKLTQPLSGVIIKTRRVIYEIPKHDFPFALIFYFIHGPIDKDNFTC